MGNVCGCHSNLVLHHPSWVGGGQSHLVPHTLIIHACGPLCKYQLPLFH